MPPIRLNIICLECYWVRKGFMNSVLRKADDHAAKRGHQLVAMRPDGTRFCFVNPPETIEFESR